MYVSKKGSTNIIDSILRDNLKICCGAMLAGTLQNNPAEPVTKRTEMTSVVENAEIERNGSERAVVKLTGKHRNADGRQWLPWTIRLYFYSASPDIRLTHSFVFDGDQDKDFINALGIRFDVPMSELPYNRLPAAAFWPTPTARANASQLYSKCRCAAKKFRHTKNLTKPDAP